MLHHPVYGVMDLGSNTFHLLIYSWEGNRLIPLFTSSLAAKIGEGGFGTTGLLPEAMDRGIEVLTQFKAKLKEYQVEKWQIIGTSALRQASNASVFIQRAKEELDFDILVISGQEEASLIYEGIKAAVPIQRPSLLMDIGGGSVEFILTDHQTVVWQTSLEIGGLRLMEKFHKYDPLPLSSIERLHSYLREALLPVTNAVHQYAPEVLIGSSGTFDTLVDMWWMKTQGKLPSDSETNFSLSLDAFQTLRQEILPLSETDRRNLPGMIPLRSGMIPVALVLIDHVIQSYQLQEILVSRYSLREGACYAPIV